MTPSQLFEAQELLQKRADTKALIADLGTAGVYALELQVPARDRIVVFSNHQPAAEREISTALGSTIIEAAVVGLTAEVTEIEAKLTGWGVTDFDQPALEAETA